MTLLLIAFALGIVLGFWLAMATVGGLLLWLALRPIETDVANVTVPLWLDGREMARAHSAMRKH